MEIYIVQQGDTIETIANSYGISVTKLAADNGLEEPYNLVVGQTIVIAFPVQTYTIQDGDTLEGIANSFNVSVMQLLRNNPGLVNRDFIYPGETITISYNNSKGKYSITGIAYPFIRKEVLRKTLPYLTYLTIFNYQVTTSGKIIQNSDDTEVIQIAKEFGVAPIMLLTTLSNLGVPNPEAAYNILLNQDLQNEYVNEIHELVREKGYYGIDVTFQYVNASNLPLYVNFLTKLSNALTPEGYTVFVTINPQLNATDDQITFENVDYSALGQIANSITFLSYDWGFAVGPPSQASIITTETFLDYIVTQIPLEKIKIGMPTLGYDWPLPYVEGLTKASALNFDSSVTLAYEVGATIQYDEQSLSAYFNYVVNSLGSQQQHVVWFKDARSVNSAMNVLMNYQIHGTAVWNVMYFFSQLWLVINTQYEIDKVLT